MIALKKFLQEVREQLEQISWPNRAEVSRLTIVVLFVTIIASIIFGGIDFLFTKFMAWLTLWH